MPSTLNLKKIAIYSILPIAVVGWALFRPDLLFVDQKVNESKPAASTSMVVGEGMFESYGHETTGKAEILRSGDKSYVRLSNFKTSNGPDVHVLLLKGTDPKAKSIVDGSYIDLGSIKGNIGDQNYEIPAGTNLEEYQAVNIWCKRFAVAFGGASLKPSGEKQMRLPTTQRHASFGTGLLQLANFGEEIKVTFGAFRPDAAKVQGMAEIVEKDGKRFLRLSGVKVAGGVAGVRVLLVKAETVRNSTTVMQSEKVDLGPVTTSGQLLPISKDLDVWLYRSVSLWSTKSKKNLGAAALRSSQEKPAAAPLA